MRGINERAKSASLYYRSYMRCWAMRWRRTRHQDELNAAIENRDLALHMERLVREAA